MNFISYLRNPFKFNLVQFNDFTYGVRTGLFTYTYLDLDTLTLWSAPTNVNTHCKGSLEKAKRALLDYENFQLKEKYMSYLTKSKFI